MIVATAAAIIYGLATRPQKTTVKEDEQSVQREYVTLVPESTPVNPADGSVIVTDRGASFRMVPNSSSNRPVVVTEEELRNRIPAAQ